MWANELRKGSEISWWFRKILPPGAGWIGMVPKYPRIFRNRFRFILVPKYPTTPASLARVALLSCFISLWPPSGDTTTDSRKQIDKSFKLCAVRNCPAGEFQNIFLPLFSWTLSLCTIYLAESPVVTCVCPGAEWPAVTQRYARGQTQRENLKNIN